MKNLNLIIILITLLTACDLKQKKVESYALSEREDIPITRSQELVPPPPPSPLNANQNSEKKIIRNGRMEIEVSDLQKSKTEIDILKQNYGAYYAEENFNNTNNETSFNLIIKIPYLSFDHFIAKISLGAGKIKFKEINANDVTEEFIDLETRLSNKRNYLERYNELLKQAKTVKDIIEIEDKIRVIEEEIESSTGRLKYISNQVEYSTLHLVISQKKDFRFNPVNGEKFTEKLKQSLIKGWFGLVDFILFMIKIWPVWIIVIAFILFWRKFKRTKKVVNKKIDIV